MPMSADALGVPVSQALCRHEVGTFLKALETPDDVVVACTQEKPLFEALAESKPDVAATGLRFVNIRELAGWGKEGRKAGPKMKARLALAALPLPDPLPSVSYQSQGRLLVVGPGEAVRRAMGLLGSASESLKPTALVTDNAMPPVDRRHPVLTGTLHKLEGFLGRFRAEWRQGNPIDLEVCTRCGECVKVCPEGAITDWFQIDMSKCVSSRDCQKACDAVGAIRFDRNDDIRSEAFDLVLDLRREPAFGQADPPMGYHHLPQSDPMALAQVLSEIAGEVGEFEKPKFFRYESSICAHGRNGKVGCSSCIDVCSTQAIRSVFAKGRGHVEVNPNLCLGCGACATVCPSGAMRYAFPDVERVGLELRTMLKAYREAGGDAPALLIYGEEARLGGTADLLEAYGQRARLGKAAGIPAHVLPYAVHHAANLGMEVWLGALAYGFHEVILLLGPKEEKSYGAALRDQVHAATAMLDILGLPKQAIRCAVVNDPADLDGLWTAAAPAVVREPGRFAFNPDKRMALEAALDHLIRQGRVQREAMPLPAALPAGSPIGGLALDTSACTLCMSCVGSCPEGALKDGGAVPLLSFIERNCVQCGICVQTCPERALALDPRLAPLADRREPVVLHESEPFCCVRCKKPFATQSAIDSIFKRIGSHPAFQGAAGERLKMCSDCRVVDMVEKEI